MFAAAPEVAWEAQYYITGCNGKVTFQGLSGALNECVVGRPDLRIQLKAAAAGAVSGASRQTRNICALVRGPAAMSADVL